MNHDDSASKNKRYTLRGVSTPIVNSRKPADAKTSSLIRAANEDDDLYDPYSDYHDGTLREPEFEKEPWK